MLLSVIEHVMPDFPQILMRRFQILKEIHALGPIGRRALAEKLGLTERVLRSEVSVLKKQSLISTSKLGMTLTKLGQETLKCLDQWIDQQSSIQTTEKKLAYHLGINHCIIVPGDSDKSVQDFEQMSRMAVDLMDSVLPEGKQTIAVMGGSTMKEVARQMPSYMGQHRELLFVPARGGLGEEASLEANVIAVRMAEKSGGQSRSLYAPDHVNPDIYQYLLQEPDIKNTLSLVEDSSLLIYSIGEAEKMAERRGLSKETIDLIKSRQAVAESFGEFIDMKGQVVHKLSSVGLQSDALKKIEHIIVVAGGRKKAKAIIAHLKTVPSRTWLVTDEAAANEILNG